MKGRIRSFFPGGNTSQGFYSFYQYILGQREAEHIVCIKGGPGTGKSSLMKGISKHFLERGEDVDYFWCSSDPDSLDGILLKDRKIVILDGTSPHIVDPVNPGAVDSILNLGDYWDGAALKKYKAYIMQSNKTIKQWFGCAYNYLKAGSFLRKTLTEIYNSTVLPGELYKVTAEIVNREFSHKPITLAEGQCKKYFATAITPKGNINHTASLIKDYNKLYCLNAPVGFATERMLEIIAENVVHRGFSVEKFYCPMDPENKVEHLLIPELEMGFLTLNSYHDMDQWDHSADFITVEMREFIDWNSIEKCKDVIAECEENSDMMVQNAVKCLKEAKREHDILEEYYVPNMNFEKIENLQAELIAKIEQNEL